MTLSSQTDHRQPADTPPGGPRSAGSATLALTRVEGLRLLRSPAVLAAVALVLAIWVIPLLTGSADRFPELHEADAGLQSELLLLACGALIAANLAVLRSHRHGTDVFYDVVALPTWRRTLAHLLALLPLAATVGVLSVARTAQLTLQSGAIGRPDPLVLAAGPALVLLFGALGVLLGRLVRSAVVAPLAVVFVLFSWLFGIHTSLPYRLVRFGPTFTGEAAGDPVPPELLDRPAAAHLLYLLGLITLVAVAALLRTGAPRLPVVAVAVAAAVATAIGGGGQAAGPSAELTARRAVAEERPAAMQQCRPRDSVTYCAFPVFAPRIEAWDQVVQGVRRRVPAPSADAPFTVRQRVATSRSISLDWNGAVYQPSAALESWRDDDQRAGTPDPVSVGTEWGNGATAELGFAAHVAYRMVQQTSPGETSNLVCGGAGTVIVWLAGQATAQTRAGARDMALQSFNRTESFSSATLGTTVDVGRREIDVAYALLDQPADRVAALIARSWTELTAPKTTIERAAELLGIQAAPALPQVPAGEESTLGDCG